jgi:hypothetical protein
MQDSGPGGASVVSVPRVTYLLEVLPRIRRGAGEDHLWVPPADFPSISSCSV